MHCNNCGTKLTENAAFCEKCGFPVKKDNDPVSTNKETKKMNRKPIVMTIIAAVLLIAICIAVLQIGVLSSIKHNLGLGYKYSEEGNYEEAILAFNKVIEIGENNIEARFGLADVYETLGEHNKAENYLREILKIDSENERAKEKLNTIAKNLYADKNLKYTIEEKDVNDSNATFKGIIRCKDGEALVWEHETETAIRTELETISKVYEDEKMVYYVCAGDLNALDKYTGETIWKTKNVGASNSIVYDKENIYLSGYYGPNLMVISKKDGKVLHRNNDEEFGWVYDLKLQGKEVVLYYDLPDEGGIKKIDISNYVSGSESVTDNEPAEDFSEPSFSDISSSSNLTSKGNVTYYARNVIDGNSGTAWVEGASDSGIGEKIFFKSSSEQKVSYLKIMNGYCKSEDLYMKNNRVKNIRVVFSDGTSIDGSLNDEFANYDLIVLTEPVFCNEFYIEITDVYRGTHYDDTCISEIVIG